MSVVNNALSKLAEQKNTSPSELKKAEVPELPKKSYAKYLVIMGVILITAAAASWLFIPEQMVEPKPKVASVVLPAEVEAEVSTPAPTVVNVVQKPSASHSVKIFSSEQAAESDQKAVVDSSAKSEVVKPAAKIVEKKTSTAATKPANSSASNKTEPVDSKSEQVKPKTTAVTKPAQPVKATAKVAPAKNVEPTKVAAQKPVTPPAAKPQASEPVQGMAIEQVELTPQQLAEKSISRANKAVEANDLSTALSEYTRALRYVPGDDTTRRKLAALYYGKRQIRKSIELLQQGIRIDEDNEQLRMSLSKLLVKEEQLQAALSPLTHLPKNVSNEYLALRAGIAQQVKNTDIALESYLSLATREPDNGRWWLGLGIQQERSLMFDEAKQSYANALKQIGISNNSKSFIRQRLELIENMGDAASGN
jgi:MSHA biogenesis protein MshN